QRERRGPGRARRNERQPPRVEVLAVVEGKPKAAARRAARRAPAAQRKLAPVLELFALSLGEPGVYVERERDLELVREVPRPHEREVLTQLVALLLASHPQRDVAEGAGAGV